MRTQVGSPLAGLYAYSNRFLETMGQAHGVGSPLGAWSLLALLAHDAPAGMRPELEAVLGCDAAEAHAFVLSLLEQDHPAVAVAFGAWILESAATPAWSEWLARLPSSIARGPMPTQAEADAWMSKATRGQIARLPLEIGPLSAALLASGIAMDGRWQCAFDVASSDELGPHQFEQHVERVLLRSDLPHSALVRTEAAGIVGALVQEAREAYAVISVVAPEGSSRATAIAAAHEVAAMWQGSTYSSNISLFDLPVGDGPDWSIEEREFEDVSGPKRRERSTVYIPAWDAEDSKIDLLGHPDDGFTAAIPLFKSRLKPAEPDYTFEAAQAAKARFHQYGFTAAAGTAFMATRGASFRESVYRCVERHLTLRFRRPFAAVAVAKSPREYQDMKRMVVPFRAGPHPWENVPCFSAWVTRPTEVALLAPGDSMDEWEKLFDFPEPIPEVPPPTGIRRMLAFFDRFRGKPA